MNHNPYNFQVGDKVILDEEYSGIEVKIIYFTPLYMYCIIENIEGERWQTMTNRLTPIKK